MAFKRSSREPLDQPELDDQPSAGLARLIATVEQSVEQLRESDLSNVRYREIVADDKRSQDEAFREASSRRFRQRNERVPYVDRWSWDDLKK